MCVLEMWSTPVSTRACGFVSDRNALASSHCLHSTFWHVHTAEEGQCEQNMRTGRHISQRHISQCRLLLCLTWILPQRGHAAQYLAPLGSPEYDARTTKRMASS